MNFEFSDEQNLIRDQASGFLAENCSPDVVRQVLDGEELYAADLWQKIVEMGWTATVIPEEYGGLGLGYLELVVIAEELGKTCAPVPFGSSVFLATEAILAAGSDAQKEEWLPKFAAGEVIGTLAYAEGGGQTTAADLTTTVTDGKISGSKTVVADAQIAQLMIVAARSDKGDGASLYVVPMAQDGVSCEHVHTLDPTSNHANVSFDGADADLLGEDGAGWTVLQALLDRAAVLYAWEQLGGAETCLIEAKEYAMGRYAFGRPIASYQAIKHKLADMYVYNTLARSNAYFGAWALNTNAPELPLAAATARVGSTQAYYYASKENIQTHGGMGYTWEFDCQFYYRRSKVLSVNIGSEGLWQQKLLDASELADDAA
ncbi:MAG: acyl-CoA dehydrogenase family protein [Pseudomonadota bacterium]|nr:acyl-CoA dehydrogenase family protein [Pseudomonadota bacterium]